MTKSTITRESLEQLADNNTICKVSWDERIELAQIALAAMDCEPVAYIDKQWTLVYYVPPMSMGLKIGDKLYRHAQPAPVAQKEPISFDEWSRKCALQITLCYPDFREKAQYIWDSARETQQPAPVVPAVSDDIGEIRVGRLPTMNQDDYPGLGDWWVQLRIGEDSDEVLARVYGATPQEANNRAEALACRAAMLSGGKP
ncbi:TPA: hypothetical protein ACGW1T_003731 [Raoultella ornithinolytica]